MKRLSTLCSALLLLATMSTASAAQKKPVQEVKKVALGGYIGQRYNDCLSHRVKTENVDTLISVFQKQDEEQNLWGSEFWGKWIQGAIGMYHNTQDPELKNIIQDAQDRLIACQLPNGYIGDYDAEHQLSGWDVWGRKYTILGLLKWYWETGDKKSLKAATRLLDYTMKQIPAQKSIVQSGFYMGMPPASILEPTMFMYQTTKEKRYLDFAKYIMESIESPEGPKLISKADVPVAKRFPIENPDNWWSATNGQKAYEMMSCYVGMLELFRETKDPALLESAKIACRHIIDEEINICGSGASYECWYGGKKQQERVAMHTMETCVTFTWMQFCERLLEFTGDASYVDQIERTMYNALMASMKIDGSQIVKYTPMEGYRHEGEHQCFLPINCCNANAPRAFAMIPRIQYRLPETDRIDINLYIPGTADIQLGKNNVCIEQVTEYPKDGKITIAITPEKEAEFTVALRIPAWSKQNTVEVNGEKIEGVKNGSYCLLNRTWKPGDQITVDMEMNAIVKELNHMQAIERGPIVLARDTRFRDGFVDDNCVIPTKNGIVELESVKAPKGIWMAFRVKMARGAYAEGETDKQDTYFCDFASAGNTWDQNERYRVWLPRTLNARYDPFGKFNVNW